MTGSPISIHLSERKLQKLKLIINSLLLTLAVNTGLVLVGDCPYEKTSHSVVANAHMSPNTDRFARLISEKNSTGIQWTLQTKHFHSNTSYYTLTSYYNTQHTLLCSYKHTHFTHFLSSKHACNKMKLVLISWDYDMDTYVPL